MTVGGSGRPAAGGQWLAVSGDRPKNVLAKRPHLQCRNARRIKNIYCLDPILGWSIQLRAIPTNAQADRLQTRADLRVLGAVHTIVNIVGVGIHRHNSQSTGHECIVPSTVRRLASGMDRRKAREGIVEVDGKN